MRPGTVVYSDVPLTADSSPISLPADATPVTPRPAPAPPPASRPAVDTSALPSYQQVALSGRVTLPELRLDMHVFAETPEKRFVFVNMRKYREGERTDNGTRIETITPEGVVLDHRGHRFILYSE